MPDAIVLSDRLGYLDKDGVRQSAAKGEKVTLSAEDFDRHERDGAVAKPGKAAQEALAGDEPDTEAPAA